MATEAVEEYRSSLADLNCNSKPLINMLTMLAEDHKQYAPQIVQVIEAHLQKVDEKTRQAMFKLRQTWAELMPNKKLYALDLRVSQTLDPAWPITAKEPVDQPPSIHINPKFLKDQSQPAVEPPVQSAVPVVDYEDIFRREQEELMRQQLFEKQQELLRLHQQRLELELAETKARLEQQAKELQVKEMLLNQQQSQVSNSSSVNSAQVHSTTPTVSTAPTASRDPRARDPRVSRDPRVARQAKQQQQQQQQPQQTQEHKQHAPPAKTAQTSSPVQTRTDQEGTTKNTPEKSAASKVVTDKKPASKTSPGAKVTPDKAKATKTQAETKRKESPKGCKVLGKETAEKSKQGNAKSKTEKPKADSNKKEVDKNKRDTDKRSSKESENSESTSAGSRRTSSESSRGGRGSRNYRGRDRADSPESRTSRSARRTNRAEVRSRSRSPRGSRSPRASSPSKSQNRRPSRSSVDEKNKSGDRKRESKEKEVDKEAERPSSSEKDDKTNKRAPKRGSKEKEGIPETEAPPNKKGRKDQDVSAQDNDNKGKLSDDLSELFGKEDVDYRRLPPLAVDKPNTSQHGAAPPPSPGHAGWARFKADRPEFTSPLAPHPFNRQHSDEGTDPRGTRGVRGRPGLRGRRPSGPLLPSPPIRPHGPHRQQTQISPETRRLSTDPNLSIPRELEMNQMQDILKQAERQLQTGELSHSQHQELLKQLNELMKLQSLRVKLREEKEKLGEESEAVITGGSPPSTTHHGLRPEDAKEFSGREGRGPPHPRGGLLERPRPEDPRERGPPRHNEARPFHPQREPLLETPGHDWHEEAPGPKRPHRGVPGEHFSRTPEEGRSPLYVDADDGPNMRGGPNRHGGPRRPGHIEQEGWEPEIMDGPRGPRRPGPMHGPRGPGPRGPGPMYGPRGRGPVDGPRGPGPRPGPRPLLEGMRGPEFMNGPRGRGPPPGGLPRIPRLMEKPMHDEYPPFPFEGEEFTGPEPDFYGPGDFGPPKRPMPPPRGGPMKSGSMSEVVIDDRPFELRVGVPRKIGIDGKPCEVIADPNSREIFIDGRCYYRIGDPVREVIIHGKTHKVFFHGPQKTIWIGAMPYEIRIDAPPQRLLIDQTVYEFKVNGPTKEMFLDGIMIGKFGQENLEMDLDGQKFEINFKPPPREILIDGKLCQLMLDTTEPVVAHEGKYYGICFDGPPREIIIDDQPWLVPMDHPRKVRIGKRPHMVAFGGPGFEVLIDGKMYEVHFNGIPREVVIAGRTHTLQLLGAPPEVKILGEVPWQRLGLPPESRPPVKPGGESIKADVKEKEKVIKDGQADVAPGSEDGTGPNPPEKGKLANPEDTDPGWGPVFQTQVNKPHQQGPPQNRDQFPGGGFRGGRGGGGGGFHLGAGRGHPDNRPNMPGTGRGQRRDRYEEYRSRGPQDGPQFNKPGMGPQGVRPMGQQQQGNQQPGGMMNLQAVMGMQGMMMPGAMMGMQGMMPGQGMMPFQAMMGQPFMSQMGVPFMQQQPQPQPQIHSQIDVNDLFSKLLSAGIIKSDKKEQTQEEKKEEEAEGINEKLEDVPDLTAFKTEDMKEKHKGVIQRLYQGIQCSSCAVRFAVENTEKYREHLDWHFRQNKKEKEDAKVAKHRKWYYEMHDWIQYEEIVDDEETGALSFFDQGGGGGVESVGANPAVVGAEPISCPAATGNESDDICDVCHDPFEQFWDEEAEEWHLKDAIRINGKTYHPVCYEDPKEGGFAGGSTPTSPLSMSSSGSYFTLANPAGQQGAESLAPTGHGEDDKTGVSKSVVKEESVSAQGSDQGGETQAGGAGTEVKTEPTDISSDGVKPTEDGSTVVTVKEEPMDTADGTAEGSGKQEVTSSSTAVAAEASKEETKTDTPGVEVKVEKVKTKEEQSVAPARNSQESQGDKTEDSVAIKAEPETAVKAEGP
ncbi:pre-mRNA cleavage complex 2 protein Pcf11 isoform X2 [Lingula anatina]|uniref:Pre-mRNA cleavage complex 2 protein Pcf11 isoform X2 n=1 Tax=Lingula anatina TaxID=7574 RepID=A0A1S3KBD5_LINAN|nr:pre-mRNA cleavage complex 2 protein Pcf11 isoform X2 [Lingula anatina]|eukprot:XP_013419945.1 pre-mRNA cleavage complex 2 protein Pcf11 isoform X2 [Lingula anatina]